MKFFSVATLIFLNCYVIVAQTIPNSKFKWNIIGKCGPSATCTQVFLKAETDPIIDQQTEDKFEQLVTEVINDMKLDNTASGILKLKLLFLQGQHLCLSEVGFSGLEIAHEKMIALSNQFELIDQLTYGTLRNKPVNTQGYLYINIKNGKLESMRNVNFTLRDTFEH